MKKYVTSFVFLPLTLLTFTSVLTTAIAAPTDHFAATPDTDSLPTGHYEQVLSAINEGLIDDSSVVATDTDSVPAKHFDKLLSAINEDAA